MVIFEDLNYTQNIITTSIKFSPKDGYFSDQPTIYGELVRAKSIEEDVDNNTISVEASEGFSVQNVSKVGNQPKSVLSFLCLV